jgi:hypothetical protein
MTEPRTPPVIADLVWNGHTAPATSAFWNFYNVDRGLCRAVGISVRLDATWTVVYDPHAANDATTAAVIEKISGKLAEANLSLVERQRIEAERAAERKAANERWLADVAERKAQRNAELEQQFRHRQSEAVEQARACIEKFGEFAVRKQLLREAVTNPSEALADADAIKRVFDAIEETAVKHRHQLWVATTSRPDTDDVDWSDETVETAVIALTDRDDDHAREENGIGWSKSTSSHGHWCRMMLTEDRQIAIKAARKLVGKHRRQLAAAGVIEKDAA